MAQATPSHPSLEQLSHFGLGHLSVAEAEPVARHVEGCADCLAAVQRAIRDSSIGRVRKAAPAPPGTPIPPGTLSRSALSGNAETPAAPPADMPPELAQHPKFRIIRELGRGGMGVIYLAEHRTMQKPVALKVISPAVLANPDSLARFQAEVRAAGKLDHPNIARAYDADQAGDLHFLVMEYIQGTSLADYVETKGALSVALACHCIRQTALALQHAFEQGMVHRDIKPQNLMITAKGVVKVLDFGLARLRDDSGPAKQRLTQVSAFMGTPEYVAPEQALDARQADTRSDIYSLGCTLYTLLTGRPPFVEDTAGKLVLAQIEKEPPLLHELRTDVPAALSAVAAKMLAKKPAERYQVPNEIAQALVPFIKPGTKLDVQANPAPRSAGTTPSKGTALGANAGKVGTILRGAPGKTTGNADTGKPFADLTAATAPPRKTRPAVKAVEQSSPIWYRRWPVLAGGGGVALLLLSLAGLWAAGVFRQAKAPDQSNTIQSRSEPLANADTGRDTKPKQEAPAKPSERKAENPPKPDDTDDGQAKANSKAAPMPGAVEQPPAHDANASPEIPDATAPQKAVSQIDGLIAGQGFVPLFNGTNLDGWRFARNNGGTWQVQAGELVGIGGRGGAAILQTIQDYSNFRLLVEISTPSAAAAVCLGHFAQRDARGYLINTTQAIKPKGESTFAGTIGRLPAKASNEIQWSYPANAQMLPDGIPYLVEIKVNGNQISTYINGQPAAECKDADHGPRAKAIQLICRSNNEAHFRKIAIKELPATAPAPVVTAPAPMDPLRHNLDRAKAAYAEACQRVDRKLLAAFDSELRHVREQLKGEKLHRAIETLNAEKAAFQQNQNMPWSPRMRSAVIEYLRGLKAAGKPLRQTFIQAMEHYDKAGRSNESEALKNERDATLFPRVAGIWEGDIGRLHWRHTLYVDGSANDRNKNVWWGLERHLLFLYGRAPNAPGGVWVNKCVIESDGRNFKWRNQKNGQGTGKLVR